MTSCGARRSTNRTTSRIARPVPGYSRPEPLMHGNRGARFTLLSYQAAKARRICCAATKCSNQTDLHLTFIDPIRRAGLRQRPSLTSMPLATDQTAALLHMQPDGPARLGHGGSPHERDAVCCPALARTALQEGPSLRCPDPEALQVRRPGQAVCDPRATANRQGARHMYTRSRA